MMHSKDTQTARIDSVLAAHLVIERLRRSNACSTFVIEL